MHSASDMDTVYKSIPKEYFASDMGGKAPSFEVLKCKPTAKKNVFFFNHMNIIVL